MTFLFSVIIYPVICHWMRASMFLHDHHGWLERIGFFDFSGASVIFSVIGWMALAAILSQNTKKTIGNTPNIQPTLPNQLMAIFGVCLIIIGWSGFTGGRLIAFSDTVFSVCINFVIAAIFGGITAWVCGWIFQRHRHHQMAMIGVVSGLISTMASANATSIFAAALIGSLAGFLVFFAIYWIETKYQRQDLRLVMTFLIAGIWGTLAVALFANPDILQSGHTKTFQIAIQLLGILVIGLYAYGLTAIILKLVHYLSIRQISTHASAHPIDFRHSQSGEDLDDFLDSLQKQSMKSRFTQFMSALFMPRLRQFAKLYNQLEERLSIEIESNNKAIEAYELAEKRKSTILNSSMDAIVIFDHKGKVLEFNPIAERCFGCFHNQIKGKDFISKFIPENNQKSMRNDLENSFLSKSHLRLNKRSKLDFQRHDGEFFPSEVSISSIDLGKSQHEFIMQIRDMTRHKKLQERVNYMVFSDPVTGLDNRNSFLEKLNTIIEKQKSSKQNVAVFFICLDKFKQVNDSLGHKAGDRFLLHFAKRLTEIIENENIIARWGGNEFVILLDNFENDTTLHKKARDILQALAKPIVVGRETINVTVWIGIAKYHREGTTAEDLIQSADIAMYQAKLKGHNFYQIYSEDMSQQANHLFYQENDLKLALTTDQLYIMYQPKIDGRNGECIGLEALLRWMHPKNGDISPEDFIPVAERSDLIIAIGKRVLRDVFSQLKVWREMGMDGIVVSVNISEKHLVSQGFIQYIRNELERYDLTGDCLEIEITEKTLISDVESCIFVINTLKSMGIKVSIDDFGTGYSSLNYLKQLSVNTLKIDQSFVRECHLVKEDEKICEVIIGLAKSFELQTVAEGIENKEQLHVLQSQGCHFFQGFFFHRPLMPKDVPTIIAARSVA